MAIRKFGNEPAKVEIREDENDPETVESVSLPPDVLEAIDRAASDPNYGVRRERPQRH